MTTSIIAAPGWNVQAKAIQVDLRSDTIAATANSTAPSSYNPQLANPQALFYMWTYSQGAGNGGWGTPTFQNAPSAFNLPAGGLYCVAPAVNVPSVFLCAYFASSMTSANNYNISQLNVNNVTNSAAVTIEVSQPMPQ